MYAKPSTPNHNGEQTYLVASSDSNFNFGSSDHRGLYRPRRLVYMVSGSECGVWAIWFCALGCNFGLSTRNLRP